MKALAELQPQSGQHSAMDSGDPLGMVLGRESAERRNINDNIVFVSAAPPLPPPPQSAVDHPNPLELMLQQTTTGMETTRSNAVGVGAPSPPDEVLLYLNNSTISPWNENMFSF